MAAPAMDELADRFAHRGVTSAFVYTREAHPAERYREHTSMDVKRHHARAFRDHCQVRRRILLDSLEGDMHRAYGKLPNMTYIVARGTIAYKAAWTAIADVEDALVQTLDASSRRRQEHLVGFYSERWAWRHNVPEDFRAGLERNGPQAVEDFYGKR